MNKILTEGKLLDNKGNLSECGYATTLIKKYDRKDIKVSKLRIKEWDYYYVGDNNYGVALTIADNGYMGLVSASILDFKNADYLNHANMFWFPLGKTNLPSSSKEGITFKEGKGYKAKFLSKDKTRSLYLKIDNYNGKVFETNIELNETSDNSLVIATPFKKNKHFYYNQKINNMKATGNFKYGNLEYTFNNAFGVLDWGRGVWTYSNTWYWSSMSGEYNGDIIGFNLGYGFGDTSNASENILFINDKYYKLNDVEFKINKNEHGEEKYLESWTITSLNNDINLSFKPILDRHDCTNALVLMQDAHQVFGKFTGHFKIDDKIIKIKDMIGFAEKVKNKW